MRGSQLGRLGETVPQRHLGRRHAAHPVDTAARRRRGRAEVHALDRRPVRVPPRHRPEDRLAQRGRPAVDVAAQQVGVVRLRLGRPCAPRGPAPGRGSRGRSARSAPPCARSCPPGSRWARGSSAHSVCLPAGARVGSTTLGCATSTKGRSACRPARTAASDACHLVERAPDVDGHRAPAGLGPPGHRAVERPVHLAGTPGRAGTGPRVGRPGGRAAPPASATNARGEVSSSTARAGGSSASDGDRAVGVDHATQAAQLVGQPLGDGRAASLHDGPAGAVARAP